MQDSKKKIKLPAKIVKIKKKHISSIISVSSNRRKVQRISLEPPRRAASNGGGIVLLRPLDAEICNETSTIRHLTFTLLRHLPFR